MRDDILDSVHRIQHAGIEVMAGMIVGFDNDDASIFEEQFRFIQDARIPISMTGMLNAVPKTPLYERLKKAGRLMAESVGDQFVFTNIVPQGMSRVRALRGLQAAAAPALRLPQLPPADDGADPQQGGAARDAAARRPQDVHLLLRMLWTCILRASPRRAWFTAVDDAGDGAAAAARRCATRSPSRSSTSTSTSTCATSRASSTL